MHLLAVPAVLAQQGNPKALFVSEGSVVFDESIIRLEPQPSQVADVVMHTEAGVLMGDNVLFSFERELDTVGGMPKDPNRRYAVIRQAASVKRRGQSMILDVEAVFDDAQVAKFICGKGFVEKRVERRAVISERRIRLIDDELKKAKGPRVELLNDDRAREERKLRDRFDELRILEGCSEP